MNKMPHFNNFGEYLYYAYANLQMLMYALNCEKSTYDTDCYKVRAKAFKAYKEGVWKIHDLMHNNVAKMRSGNFCWYCGEDFEDASELTIDHIFPRSKGGGNETDNIFLVCKHCNSSKRDMDLFEWFMTIKEEFPPIPILVHYLKNIYFYSLEHNLLEKHSEEMDKMSLPFNYRYIPLEYPEPEYFLQEQSLKDPLSKRIISSVYMNPKEYKLPERDEKLFEEMRDNYISDNEAIFFERMKEKELYDSNDEQDDLLWNKERPNAYSIYRIYRHWYMVSVPKNNESSCDEFEYACLADMLNDDFTGHEDYEQLDIKGKTNLEILREMDYKGVVY